MPPDTASDGQQDRITSSAAPDERRVLFDVMLTDQVTYPLSDFTEDGDAHAVADLLAQEHKSLSSAIADLDLYVGNLFVQVQMPDGSWSRAEVRYGADQSVEVHDA